MKQRFDLRALPSELRALLCSLLGVALLLTWAGESGFRQSLLTVAAMYGLIALGVYIPLQAGSLSAAYSAYVSIGGYTLAVLALNTSWPLWVAFVIAPVIAAAVAFILGLATMRLTGFHLVAMTLLFVVAFEKWTTDAKGVTGGAAGLSGLRHLSISSWEPTQRQLATIFLVFACLVAFAIDRVRISRLGVILRSIREAPVAVEAAGVPVAMATLVALCVGAAVASLGGTAFVASVGGLNTETFSRNILFLALFMPIVGGVETPWGSLLGALVVVHLTLNVSLFSTSGLLVLVSGVLVIQLVAPQGVLGYLTSLGKMASRLNRSRADIDA